MRGGFIIVGIIFWISVRFELPQQLTLGSECEVAQSGRYLNAEYTNVFAGLLNCGDGRRSTFSVLKRKPFYYFATEFDTTRLGEFTDESFDPLNHVNLDITFPTLSIFNRESIKNMLTPRWDSTQRFLIEVHHGDLNYIGAAHIIEVQLDFDPETERIVQMRQGTTDTYFFYEMYGSNWQFIDQVTIDENRDELPIDFSLEGFAGLPQYAFGTGLGITDITYYNIVQGRLQKCFSINRDSWLNMMGLLSDPSITLTAVSEPLLVTADEIYVEQTVLVRKENPKDTMSQLVFENVVSYSLLKQSSGKYLPDKNSPGFHSGCDIECDSSYFNAEIYACSEINKLKSNGSLKQRELLKDAVLDSTMNFR